MPCFCLLTFLIIKFLKLKFRNTIRVSHGVDLDQGHLQGSHRLEKSLNLGLLEKSLKIKSALKSTGKALKILEKSLNSTIFCRA